jgi:hypothetical protein
MLGWPLSWSVRQTLSNAAPMTRVASGPKNVSSGTPVLMGGTPAGEHESARSIAKSSVMQPPEMVWILRFVRRIDST